MNPWVFTLAAVFGIAETAHFGNNLWPQSNAEMVCDGITLVLFALSIRHKTEAGKP